MKTKCKTLELQKVKMVLEKLHEIHADIPILKELNKSIWKTK